MGQSFVCSEEGVELFLGESEELSVLFAGPASTPDSRYLYLRTEASGQSVCGVGSRRAGLALLLASGLFTSGRESVHGL